MDINQTQTPKEGTMTSNTLMQDAGEIREALARELATHGPFGSLLPVSTYSRIARRVRYLAAMTGLTVEDIWNSLEDDVDTITEDGAR